MVPNDSSGKYHKKHKPESAPGDFATHKMHHQHSLSLSGIELSKAISQTHYPAKSSQGSRKYGIKNAKLGDEIGKAKKQWRNIPSSARFMEAKRASRSKRKAHLQAAKFRIGNMIWARKHQNLEI